MSFSLAPVEQVLPSEKKIDEHCELDPELVDEVLDIESPASCLTKLPFTFGTVSLLFSEDDGLEELLPFGDMTTELVVQVGLTDERVSGRKTRPAGIRTDSEKANGDDEEKGSIFRFYVSQEKAFLSETT